MRIIVDDKRRLPTHGGYNCVRNYEYCVILLDVFRSIKFISLDYDLGSEEGDIGYDILVYMNNKKIHPEHINIHSTHPTGNIDMFRYASKHFTYSRVTNNRI